jgi:ribosomal protein S18 acetylase RimI-like enzyme
MVVDGDDVLVRCSLWWTHVPPPLNDGETLGLIGHYAAADDGAASQLLQFACERLSEHCTRVVGPMDGDTWHSYRLVTDRGTEPPFFLEPWNPDGWGQHFEAVGFEALSNYFSAINADLKQDVRLPDLEQKMADQQITVRALNPEKFEGELKHIYDISIASFQQNYLYTPISLENFMGMYLPVQQYVQPQLVTLAEQNGKAVGFQFSIPDLLQAQRGEAVDTVIIKTVAVLPEMGGSGLGSYLVADAHRTIQQMGFKRAIHALMYEDNISRKISAHYAEPMRRYTLFTKELT